MAKRRSTEFLEAEVAFRLVDPNSLPELLDKLWTASGLINMDGIMTARIAEKIKGSVHIFSTRTHGDEKERLRLSAGNNCLVAKFDRKHLVGRKKFERNIENTKRKK